MFLLLRVFAIVLFGFAFTLPSKAQNPQPYDGSQDLRPTFMGTAFNIQGGDFDGKRGYLFRIWNRSGQPIELDTIPDRFNQPIIGFLSVGAEYTDGSLSFADRSLPNEVLFATGSEVLNPSPTGAFADRPANFIAIVEPTIDQLVFTLRRRTATASISNAVLETLLIEPPESDSGALMVTELVLVQSNGTEGVFSITVANDTAEVVEDLHISVLPATQAVIIADDAVDVGRIKPGVQFSPSDTFSASAANLTDLDLTDFVFAFDDQSSLEGIDDNQNGVRDDVETLIDAVLSDNDMVRGFLRGYAREVERLYLSQTVEEADAAFTKIENFALCVDTAFDETGNDSGIVLHTLLFAVLNSNMRMQQRNSALTSLLETRVSRAFPLESEITAFCDANTSSK